MSLRILAVICARNEQLYIQDALESFIEQQIDVLLIDHDSTDQTRQIARTFLGRGLTGIERLPWIGTFSLTHQLRRKQQLIEEIDADWIIHANADEWLQASAEYSNLRAGIEAAHHANFNCLNFDEFVFVPGADERFEHTRYRERMLGYYFFEPSAPRQMRAWRKDARLSNIPGAGHNLLGNDVRMFPRNFILRHYIGLSSVQLRNKYLSRAFSQLDLAKGWHNNRINISADALTLAAPSRLKLLPSYDTREFDRSSPEKQHFWQW